MPAQEGLLWHGKIYCGNIYHGQGDANQFTDQELIDWINTCNRQGGVCTLDWPFEPRTGLLKDFGFAQLKRVSQAVKSDSPLKAGANDRSLIEPAGTEAVPIPIKGPLRVSQNPNYFQDADGNPLILCGSHSWNTLQDWGSHGSIRPLDFDTFVRFLNAHGHNFTYMRPPEALLFSIFRRW